MPAADIVGALSVSLSMESFETGAERAKRATRDLESGMERMRSRVSAGTVAVGTAVGNLATNLVTSIPGALRDMAMQGLEYASSLGEVSQQLGVTTSDLQFFRFAATQAGLEQGEMDRSLQILTRRIGELQAGVPGAVKAFEAMGLSQQQIAQVSRMTAGQALPLLAEGIASLGSVTAQGAAANELFGRSGQKLLPLLSEGAGGVRLLREEYAKYGAELTEGQISRADETMDAIAKKTNEIRQRTAGLAADSAVEIAQWTAGWEEAKIKIVGALVSFDRSVAVSHRAQAEFWADVSRGARNVDAALANFRSNVVANIAATVSQVREHLVGRLNATWEGMKAKVREAGEAFRTLFYIPVVGNSYVPDTVDEIGEHMARLQQTLVAPARAATRAATAQFQAMQQRVRGILDRLYPELAQLRQFRADRADLLGSTLSEGAKGDALARLWREQADLPANGIAGLPVDIVEGEQVDLARRVADGLRESMRSITGDHRNMAGAIEAQNVRIIESWGQMADGALQSMDRLIKGIRSGNVLDIIGGILGALDKVGQMFPRLGIPRLDGARANGGPVRAGGAYLVGERGPELLTLGSQGGFVTPNKAMAAGPVRFEVAASEYFDVRVAGVADGRVARAAPMIGAGTQAGIVRQRSRSLA